MENTRKIFEILIQLWKSLVFAKIKYCSVLTVPLHDVYEWKIAATHSHILWVIDKKDVTFRALGDTHNACWMAKVKYFLKIYLLKHQMKLTEREKANITLFLLLWFRAFGMKLML